MAAKDYRICTALANAYIAKVSKKYPNLMTDDRSVIEEDEIMMLIDWWLDRKCSNGEYGMAFESFIRDGMSIHVEFKNSEKQQKTMPIPKEASECWYHSCAGHFCLVESWTQPCTYPECNVKDFTTREPYYKEHKKNK